MILDAYDTADAQIRRLTERIETLIAALPDAKASTPTAPPARMRASARTRRLPALARLDEIPGVGARPRR